MLKYYSYMGQVINSIKILNCIANDYYSFQFAYTDSTSVNLNAISTFLSPLKFAHLSSTTEMCFKGQIHSFNFDRLNNTKNNTSCIR